MQIIPIAGRGNRFRSAGYSTAKYLLQVSGKPVIEHILSYFDKTAPTLLILNKKDSNRKQIEVILKYLRFEDFQVVEIDDTNGQLTSVVNGVVASKFHSYDGPVWIYNGDTIRKKKLPYSLLADNDCEGFIEVFKETGSHWSFVDSLGKVSKITEKERISDYCCTGLYGFKNLNRVIHYVRNGDVIKLKDELYVSGVYQNFLNDNMDVWAFESDRNDFLLCGTPSEYEKVITEVKSTK
jgi:dTDP-glucose pyrophosphorylase